MLLVPAETALPAKINTVNISNLNNARSLTKVINTLCVFIDIGNARKELKRLELEKLILQLRFVRTCSRSLRSAGNCGRTERRNRSLQGVNEDFEHRPSANVGGVVDLEQVLSKPNRGFSGLDLDKKFLNVFIGGLSLLLVNPKKIIEIHAQPVA